MATASIVYDTRRSGGTFPDRTGFSTGPVEVNELIEEGGEVSLIDVREASDFAKGHARGALNLPEAQWHNPECLRTDMVNVLYCYSPHCHLAAKAARQFSQRGYALMEMDGGYEAWKQNDLPVE